MATAQDSRTPSHILAQKPSSSYSVSSAASATSAGTLRSGGSRLLFGEIDTTSERSADSYASVCNLVLSDSSTFLRFWLTDECREPLIALLPASDLANLRLVCHDFSVRAAPALFSKLHISFRPNTFTKPSKQAALQRLGFHVKTLTFSLPHTSNTFLPPLIHPDTGDELSYTYVPRLQPLAIREPRYGDWETTEILTRQYPPLFHAAANVHAFIQAFSAFVNLSHLKISCPGHDGSSRYRPSAVDFALISLRIAVERNCLNALDTLTLSPIHPGGLLYLSPLLGYGASPSSARCWARIKHLTLHADALPFSSSSEQLRRLQSYLSNFKRNIQSLNFRWNHNKGPLPLHSSAKVLARATHPALADNRPSTSTQHKSQQSSLYLPKLQRLEIENVSASASDIGAVIALHKRTLVEVELQSIELTDGTWLQAFAPLTKMASRSHMQEVEVAEIPIMLSPTSIHTFPKCMDRSEVVEQRATDRRTFRASRWLGGSKQSQAMSKTSVLSAASSTTKKAKHRLLECESQVRRVLKGAVFAWM